MNKIKDTYSSVMKFLLNPIVMMIGSGALAVYSDNHPQFIYPISAIVFTTYILYFALCFTSTVNAFKIFCVATMIFMLGVSFAGPLTVLAIMYNYHLLVEKYSDLLSDSFSVDDLHVKISSELTVRDYYFN